MVAFHPETSVMSGIHWWAKRASVAEINYHARDITFS